MIPHRGAKIWISTADENRRMNCIKDVGRVIGWYNRRVRTPAINGLKHFDRDAAVKAAVKRLPKLRVVTLVKRDSSGV